MARPRRVLAEIGKQVPDIHYGITDEHLFGQHRLVLKTHWKFWIGLPLREDTVGVIYILRHPADVLGSCENFGMLRLCALRHPRRPRSCGGYQRTDRRGRSAIPDEFVAVTGHHRKHAIRLLRAADEARVAPVRRTPRRYGAEFREGLIALWEASDRIFGFP